ncbi:terminal uridylyltransferase 4 [Caerostris darwini]|uniref:Terminal uridylyltransferase 4 n=1 Tax=Caerostris darwini TaxID=1538125 RepID=A0AAV4TQP7_9ARAC|nr:terminal uridylyltransferase 4 [Caerostris darwini]
MDSAVAASDEKCSQQIDINQKKEQPEFNDIIKPPVKYNKKESTTLRDPKKNCIENDNNISESNSSNIDVVDCHNISEIREADVTKRNPTKDSSRQRRNTRKTDAQIYRIKKNSYNDRLNAIKSNQILSEEKKSKHSETKKIYQTELPCNINSTPAKYIWSKYDDLKKHEIPSIESNKLLNRDKLSESELQLSSSINNSNYEIGKSCPSISTAKQDEKCHEKNDSTNLLNNPSANTDQMQTLFTDTIINGNVSKIATNENIDLEPSVLYSKEDLLDTKISDINDGTCVQSSLVIPSSTATELLKTNGLHSNDSDLQVNEISSTSSDDSDSGPNPQQLEEITQYIHWVESEKSMNTEIAQRVLKDLKFILKHKYNDAKAHLYGSYQSDDAITTSNINLAFELYTPTIRNGDLLCLQKLLKKELKKYEVPPFEENPNPRRSKVLVIVKDQGITCELIFLGNTVTQYERMSNMLKCINNYDSRVKTLVRFTRLWTEAVIHEPENGMLHPIGFILLLIHFLQKLEKPLLPLINISSKNWGLVELSLKNDSSVGELWMDFLYYYSHKFNWHEDIVNVTENKNAPKCSESWNVMWIAIKDPFSGKNVAESVVTCDKAEYIISCFKSTYEHFLFSDTRSVSPDSYKNGEDFANIHGKFSLNDCAPNAYIGCCLDSDCQDDDYEPPTTNILQKELTFSKINESSLKCINCVLNEVYNEFKIPYVSEKGRKVFVQDLERYIRQLYSNAKLTLFGSSVNGFGFKSSDLDICMVLNAKSEKKISEQKILGNLTRHLRKSPFYKNVIALYKAQIPLVKFHFIPKSWNCDLSLHNILAVHNSKLLRQYAMMDERCRILGYALKLLSKKAGLADTSLRSLSSYSYILMVIHYLQQVQPPVLPVMPVHDKEAFEEKLYISVEVLKDQNYWYHQSVEELKKRYNLTEKNTSTVGELWCDLLEFYLKFDYENVVTITEKGPVPRSSLQRSAHWINIEDPFLSKRNLACILSQTQGVKTWNVLHRTRNLFGSNYPHEKQENLQSYYFSPSNLTGRYVKDIECLSCGNFGHETSECTKADPFKNFLRKRGIRYQNVKK